MRPPPESAVLALAGVGITWVIQRIAYRHPMHLSWRPRPWPKMPVALLITAVVVFAGALASNLTHQPRAMVSWLGGIGLGLLIATLLMEAASRSGREPKTVEPPETGDRHG